MGNCWKLSSLIFLSFLSIFAGTKTDSAKVKEIHFDTTVLTTPNRNGLMRWNNTDGTLDIGMSGGDVTQQVGQELFMKCRNVSGSTILNGKPVYVSGRTGNRPNIYLARSDADATSNVIGITTQDIASPADGYVTTMGYVRGIKTDYSGTGAWGTTWVAGDELYVSKTVAGQLTNVQPAAPYHSDIVGTVEIVHSSLGSILVNNNKHKTLTELSDVNGTPLTTTGQFPLWHKDSLYFDFDKNIYNMDSIRAKIGRFDTVRAGSNTSYAQMDSVNGLLLAGNATAWDDVGDIKLDNIRTTGTPGNPTWTATGLGFNKNQFAIGDSAQGTTELFHRFMQGDSTEFHLHWYSFAKDAGAAYVNWSLRYWIFNNNDSVTYSGTLTKQDTVAANTKIMTHRISSFGKVSTPNINIGARIVCVVKRIAASPATNPSANPMGSTIGIHKQVDMIGSRQIYTK